MREISLSNIVSQDYYNENILSFDSVLHKYKLNEKRIVGTTTFTKGGYPKSEGLIQWQKKQAAEYVYQHRFDKEVTKEELIKEANKVDSYKSEEAANIGTFVHDYAYFTETNNSNALDNLQKRIKESKNYKLIENGIEKFLQWKKGNNDENIQSETIVASVIHQYGGKFDRLAKRNGHYILSDFKTSSGFYIDHFLQLAAYSIAIHEWLNIRVEGLEVLRFGKETGEFQTLLIAKPQEILDLQGQALRCLETYRFRKWENDSRFKYGGKK